MIHNPQDWQLLEEYREGGSQAAFATLVERYVHFVYTTCLREVRDPTLAEDVTQVVFLLLAKKARSLRKGTVIAGWLFQTARFAAKSTLRQEMRRVQREQKAATDMLDAGTPQTSNWDILEPLLNEALATLSTAERNALLTRFFEGKSLKETGAALGLSEGAVSKRAQRALTKMRRYFAQRGFPVSVLALGLLLKQNGVQAAPASCITAAMRIGWSATPGGLATEAVSVKVFSALQGTVKSMFIAQLKAAIGAGVAVALVASSTGLLHLAAAHTQMSTALKVRPTPATPTQLRAAQHPFLAVKPRPSSHGLLAQSPQVAPKPALTQAKTTMQAKPAPFKTLPAVKLNSVRVDADRLNVFKLAVSKPNAALPNRVAFHSHATRLAQAIKPALANNQLNKGELEGQVLDQGGNPVVGAQVMSPNGTAKAFAVTDAAGKFTLTDLPEGEVMVLAGYKATLAEARDVNPTAKTPLTLTLLPIKPIPPHDVQRAYDVLDDLWAISEGAMLADSRNSIPLTMAPYDPDLAAKLVTKKDGSIDENITFHIIEKLARIDPERALAWASPRFYQIENPGMLYSLRVVLASALANTKPAQARELYTQAKTYNKEQTNRDPKNQQVIATQALELGRLAQKLGLQDEVAQFTATALTAVPGVQDPRWLLPLLAPLDYAATEKLIDKLPPDAKEEILADTIERAATEDIPTARRLREKLMALEAGSKEPIWLGIADGAVIQGMGKTDPSGALSVARQVWGLHSKSSALIMAAQFQPKDTALSLLREAEDMLLPPAGYPPVSNLALIAAMTYNLDPPAGRELFAETKTQWLKMKARREDPAFPAQILDVDTPVFAYLYSRVEPAQSRLIIEADFARQKRDAKQHGTSAYQISWVLRALVAAMAAIDVDRALELAAMLPSADKQHPWDNPQVAAGRSIAQYLLLSEHERQTSPFGNRG